MIPMNRDNQNALIKGQGFMPGWAQTAGILRPNVMTLLSDTLRDVIASGVSSEEQIAEIVARNCLRSPLPDELLSEVEKFIVNYCIKAKQGYKDIRKFLQDTKQMPLSYHTFLVFHHGRYHYYYELSKEVLELRKTVLFWICRSANQFSSRGKQREKIEWLPPRAEKMVRFLCRQQNAGRIITLSELYLQGRQPATLPSMKDMRNSVDETQNAINNFANYANVDERFIKSVSDESKQDDVKVLSVRGANKYIVGKEISAECCIIKRVS